MILGCALAIVKGALGVLWWLLAPKEVRKARRRAGKAAHRARVKAPKQAKKMRRAARRSISPKRRRRTLLRARRTPARYGRGWRAAKRIPLPQRRR